ncbi:UNVERIFIED_CONTAM: hypothetical protein K2H54_056058 [Gekko kuhli]
MNLETLRESLPVDGLHASAALACGSVAAVVVWKWVLHRSVQRKMNEARQWRDRSLKQMERVVLKFKQKNPGVQKECILSLPLVKLAEKLQEETLSPECVLYAYISQALEVTQEVNCVTDFIHGCEEQLQDIKKQKEKGLLYGIPVSIKDHIGCKGHISTCGLVHYLGKVEEDDSVIVKVLKKQGAIPFVKTNVPQSMINYDCSNPIFGQTLNPLNHKKSPGGSSGGEGALITGGGSILGFGTDVAGSIRLPSSFCGLCGLKPTGNRLSTLGLASPIGGMKSVTATIGPMARDVDSLILCMKALLCDELFHLDPSVPPIPFNEELYNNSNPLRIGYYEDDGYFQPSPSMRRAVQETKLLLQAAGHMLIPFVPPRLEYAVDELFTRGLFSDGAANLLDKFKGDIIDPNVKSQISCYSIPIWLKKILAFILKPVCHKSPYPEREAAGNPGAVASPAGQAVTGPKETVAPMAAKEEFGDLDRLTYRTEYIAEWRKLKLDVILCPALGPAFNEGYPGKLFGIICVSVMSATSYTNLYNVLNFPAGVVPVSTVIPADDEELKYFRGHYGDPWDKRFKKAVEGAVGLPVSVQCVALSWQEELCLRLMKEVETVVHEKRTKI